MTYRRSDGGIEKRYWTGSCVRLRPDHPSNFITHLICHPNGCLQNYKHEERKIQQQQQQQQQVDNIIEKVEKKERSSKNKDKREKLSEEEKELRKERKLGRKRDREEALQAEIKRKREEEKAAKLQAHQNGELMERDKYQHSRELSPYSRDRERSHDRLDIREKHRRGTDGKRR